MLLAYLELNFPGSDLGHRVQLVLSELEHLEPSEADTQGEEEQQEWVCGGLVGRGGAGPH